MIVISLVAGQLSDAVGPVGAPVVHSVFPSNRSASPMIGYLADTGRLVPCDPGSIGNRA